MDNSVSPFDPTFSFSHNAHVDTSHLAGSTYASGYFLAAHLLTQHVRKDKTERNLLVFPICYLYRHNLELNLKELISAGQRVFGPINAHVTHHRIKDLWAVGKQLLRKADPGRPDPHEFGNVDRVIDYISVVDEDAQAFRFPKKMNGDRSLDTVSEIDLESLGEMVNSVTLYLWGCIDWIDYIEQSTPKESG